MTQEQQEQAPVKVKLHDRGDAPASCQIPWFLVVIGAFLLTWGCWMIIRQHSMVSWPQTKAFIIDFKRGVSSEHGWYANPSVEYTYTVKGQTYRSTKLNPSPFNYQIQSEFEKDTGGFAPGVTTTCWYKAGKPETAYIINSGITPGPVITALSGLSLGLLIFTQWGYREWRIARASSVPKGENHGGYEAKKTIRRAFATFRGGQNKQRQV